MKLRRAVVGDEHTLAALNRFVHDMHHARRPDYYRATRVENVAAWFRDRLENSLPATWIASEEHALFRSLGFEPRVVTFERRTPRA